jgi:hypothetical protein
MMDSRANVLARTLHQYLHGLSGMQVARLVSGGSAGSVIGIYFSGSEPTHSVPKDVQHLGDRWYLGIECSWRLESPDTILTSSRDDNSDAGAMMAGLATLENNRVQRIELVPGAYDLVIVFTGGQKLTIFCDVVRDACCWYLLGPGGIEVAVEPAGSIVLGG